MALPTLANGTEMRGANPSAAAGDHSGEGDDRRIAAQILLLHTETALSYLSGSTSPQPAGTGMAGGSTRDLLPCTTFQQFVERSSVWLPSISSTVGNGREEDDAIDLLIDRVVIDGDKVRVVFKAGVEV